MYGYVRPEKSELKIKEFARYRSVYCGLCHEIARSWGQWPRVTLSYDLTFLALLLQSFVEDEAPLEMRRCLGPVGRKKPVLSESPALKYAAALSLLFAYEKFKDNRADGEHVLLSRSGQRLFASTKKRLDHLYPKMTIWVEAAMELSRDIETGNSGFEGERLDAGAALRMLYARALPRLEQIHSELHSERPKRSSKTRSSSSSSAAQLDLESDVDAHWILELSNLFSSMDASLFENPAAVDASVQQRPLQKQSMMPPKLAQIFGALLAILLAAAPLPESIEMKWRVFLAQVGLNLGRWVYVMDAVDDFKEDQQKGRNNPLRTLGEWDKVKAQAEFWLTQFEAQLDLHMQVLPFAQDGAILSNIIQMGLPGVRLRRLAEKALPRL